MSRKRLHLLATLCRVTRVHEIQARLRLMEALRNEDRQREVVEHADARQASALNRLRKTVSADAIDIGRLQVDQTLFNTLSSTLDEARENLEQMQLDREHQAHMRAQKKHRYEHLDEAAESLQEAIRLQEVRKQSESQIENWLVTKIGEFKS